MPSWAEPTRILRIDLDGFQLQGLAQIFVGDSFIALNTAGLDGDTATFAGDSSGPRTEGWVVLRVNLADFPTVGAVTSSSARDWKLLSIARGEATFVETRSPPALPPESAPYTPLSGVPLQVVRTDARDFTEIDRLPLEDGENFLRAATAWGPYGFFGTSTAPGRVVRIDRATWQPAGVLELEPGEDFLVCVLRSGPFAYFATRTGPSRIVKIDLQNFTRVGALELGAAEIESAIGVLGNFAYFTGYSHGGVIVEVDLTRFAETRTLRVNQEFVSLAGLSGTTAYLSAGFNQIAKVDLEQWRPLASRIVIPNYSFTEVVAVQGDFAYLGDDSGHLVRFDLRRFAPAGSLRLPPGMPLLSAVTTGGVGYFGSCLGQIVRVDLTKFRLLSPIQVAGSQGCFSSAVGLGGDAYFGASVGQTYGGEAVKLSGLGQRGFVKASRAELSSPASLQSISLHVHPGRGRVRVALYSADKKLLWQSASSRLTGREADLSFPVSRGTPASLHRLRAGSYYLAWQVASDDSVTSYRGRGDGWQVAQAFGPFPPQVSGEQVTNQVWTEFASN